MHSAGAARVLADDYFTPSPAINRPFSDQGQYREVFRLPSSLPSLSLHCELTSGMNYLLLSGIRQHQKYK
jgi:hypothetical protein